MSNGTTPRWIAIIVSIAIFICTVSFGAVQYSRNQYLSGQIEMVEKNAEDISRLKVNEGIVNQKLDDIKEDVREIKTFLLGK